MSDAFDDFSDMAGRGSTGRKGDRAAIMILESPSKNSVEMSIRELAYTEPALAIDIEFIEEGTAPVERTQMEPGLAAAVEDIGLFYFQHAALARSLGPDASYQDYVDACHKEQMTPLVLRDFTNTNTNTGEQS